VTPRNFAKSAGFDRRPKRYPSVSLFSIGGEGGLCGHSLKSVEVFDLRQQIRCSEVLGCPQEQVSLASSWLNLV
jgi:hypothetical protein